MSRSILKFGLEVAILVLVGISSWSVGWIPFLPSIHAQGVAQVVVNPSSIASLTNLPGSNVTFQINTTDSSPFAGFGVAFFYNISVLQNPQVDYSNNVLDAPGNPATVISECVNGYSVSGSGNVCNPDIAIDGIGVVSLELITTPPLGNTTTPNGKLFSVTFTVGTIGFSPIHVVKSLLVTEPNGTFLPVVTHDSYFTNTDCPSGSGIPCRPPIVSLNAPQTATIGNAVVFDASASFSQNQNGTITHYLWVWASGLDRSFLTTSSPFATHTFTLIGVWTVTLTVQDNYGTSGIETVLVAVTNPLLASISVGDMFFTDTDLNYLHIFHGLPEVNVDISSGVVRTVNPRQVLAWVSITNDGVVPLQSINVNEKLPLEWEVNPAWKPEKVVHVYFANTSSLATNPEITRPSTITVSPGIIERIQVAIPSFNATELGHPLMPGQSILLSINLSYTLIGTSQSATTYPRYYISGIIVKAWPMTGFVGNNPAIGGTQGTFIALAKSVGQSSRSSTIV